MNVLSRNAVAIRGSAGPVLMFAHGFGCDQSMWGRVARDFEQDHRVVLFDHVGAGASDTSAFTEERYADLQGYADDVTEICETMDLGPVVLIGHSVSATIAVLAAVKRPELFAGLVLVCPSPRHTNTEGYAGGLEESDIDELLTLMAINQMEWTTTMAPVVMGAGAPEDIQADWRNSVCRTDPFIAKSFARTTFTADHRAEYHKVTTPTLIIACSDDMLAPQAVSAYVHQTIAGSQLARLEATGHSPHMTHPKETIAEIRRHLLRQGAQSAAVPAS